MSKVVGYRKLSEEEIELMNEGKELAEKVRVYTEKLSTVRGIDYRWLSIGVTDLQKGFMSTIRSIAKPSTF